MFKKQKKSLSQILDVFNQMQVELSTFIDDQTRRSEQIDSEILALEGEQSFVDEQRKHAESVFSNIQKLVSGVR